MTAAASIETRARLSPDEVRAVVELVDEVTDTDGVRPLSEHVMLHLRYGGDERARNFLVRSGDEIVGYAHLDTTDAVEGASAELAVSPRHRGKGYGRQLVKALFAETTDLIGPLGAKSQGECGINPVAPAVSNALANATGVRFAHLPFTPDRLFAKLAATA